MRRPIIVIFLLLACFTLTPAGAAERGALFKVSKGEHSLLLFGTMHVGRPEFYPLEPRLTAAIAAAPVLALELDPLQDPANVARVMQQEGMCAPPGCPGASAALQSRVARALLHAGIPAAATANMKPWLVAMLIGLAEYTAQGYRSDMAVDRQLALMARDAKVPVVELESMALQLGLFNQLPPDAQWRFLDDTVALSESGKEADEVRRIVTAWSTADKAGLDAVADSARKDTSFSGQFVQQVLLDARNGPLADKLVKLLADEDKAVAAIGVLHLVGPNSVPALLRARGLTVERIY